MSINAVTFKQAVNVPQHTPGWIPKYGYTNRPPDFPKISRSKALPLLRYLNRQQILRQAIITVVQGWGHGGPGQPYVKNGGSPTGWFFDGAGWSAPGYNEALVSSTPFKAGLSYPQSGYGPLTGAATTYFWENHPTGRYQHWYGDFDINAYPGATYGRWFYSGISVGPGGTFIGTKSPTRYVETVPGTPRYQWSRTKGSPPSVTTIGTAIAPFGGSPYGKTSQKEKKLSASNTVPLWLLHAISTITELLDLWQIMSKLTGFKYNRWIGGPRIYQQFDWIVIKGHWREIEASEFLKEALAEWAQDRQIALFNKKGHQLWFDSQYLPGNSTHGPTVGPAIGGGFGVTP